MLVYAVIFCEFVTIWDYATRSIVDLCDEKLNTKEAKIAKKNKINKYNTTSYKPPSV